MVFADVPLFIDRVSYRICLVTIKFRGSNRLIVIEYPTMIQKFLET